VSTRAIAELRRSGIAHTVREYAPAATAPGRHERPSYGLDAAAALSVDPRRIFKTLVAAVDGSFAVAIVPVAGELDLKALAEALGGRRAEMADPGAAERATGYVVGGISPLGQRKALPTLVDETALEHQTVYVSAGRRGLEIELAPGDLVALTRARVKRIRRVSA